MIASAPASCSIAACRLSDGNPVTVAWAISTARGASSIIRADAVVPISRRSSRLRCVMRSASILVVEGSLVPALMTAR